MRFLRVQPFQATLLVNGGQLPSLGFIFYASVTKRNRSHNPCFLPKLVPHVISIIRFQFVKAVDDSSKALILEILHWSGGDVGSVAYFCGESVDGDRVAGALGSSYEVLEVESVGGCGYDC
ncbi:hypothetical protein AAHE18_10G107200 [Arachis hypogaea]